MDRDGARAAEEPEPEPAEDDRAKTFVRLNDLSGDGGRSGPGDQEKDPSSGGGDSESEGLPYPALAPVVFFYLSQHSRPRSWCLRMVCNPYPLHGFEEQEQFER
uniref:Voltage-dependent T-type calcium channel subunit alpha-1G n=1 Tax=Sphaerodactylus townsendi TaxID=933632 RepID=A0ACB8EKQ5_9SAUR